MQTYHTNNKVAATDLRDQYVDTMIWTNPHHYDRLEVHGVRDTNAPDDPAGTACEVDNVNPQFFSVYARHKQGDYDCINDFPTYFLAISCAKKLASEFGLPIFDAVANSDAWKHAVDLLISTEIQTEKQTPRPNGATSLLAFINGLPLSEALWWFIENVNDD